MAHAGPRAHLVTETGSSGTAPNNKWEPFFGTPNGYHEEVRADDQLSHETYNLPKAYEGRNKRLEDILDFMIREEDEFYTRDLLPWEATDDLSIVWDVWKFNRTLADVVPEQGISRLVTQENERHTDNLVRRGLAFQLEHGFMTTEKGRRNYALNLQQISDAVHTTCYFGVIHALFAGQNYYKEYRRKFARYVKGPRTLFRHERQMWACLQKDIKGVYIMDAEIKHHMKLNGITPDVLVLPPKAGIYISMVPPTETTYSERGPGAREALTDNRTDIQVFRGCKVFEAQSFDVDFQHEFIDLTARPRMVGEYFVIPGTTAPHDLMSTIGRVLDKIANEAYERGAPRNINDVLDVNPAMQEDPFIHIYSAEKDDYVKITYAQAAAAALNRTDNSDGVVLKQYKEKLDEYHRDFENIAKSKVAEEKSPSAKKEVAAMFGVKLGPNSRIGYISSIDSGATEEIDIFNVQAYFEALEENLNILRKKKETKTEKDDDKELALQVGIWMKELEILFHKLYLRHTCRLDRHKYDILVMRPFETYTMHSAIMAKGGSDLGSVYHGHHDFQLSDNVATKTHFGNYTFYSKPVVKRPRNYTIIPDCFAQGYISGEGHHFFMPPSGDKEGDLQRAIEEGSLGSADCHHSLIAWMIPRGEGEMLSDAIDITGRFAGSHRDYEKGGESHFTGADALSAMESIEELDQNRTDEAYLHQVQHINTVCFRGAQYTNGKFTHHGKGHWGTPYAGVLPVRDGALMYMDPAKEPQKGDEIV